MIKKGTEKLVNLPDRSERIREMFNAIAPRYDLLNRLLSLGVDRRWRRFAVGQIRWTPGGRILDVATGTADVALEIAAQTPDSVHISGIDFSSEMVERGRDKIQAAGLAGRVELLVAPCEAIPFADATFDAVIIAFGIRNVVDRLRGLQEMARVLKPGGTMVVLEFSTPRSRLFAALYRFYFHSVLPRIGGILSDYRAYRYLPASVEEFPARHEFMSLMRKAGVHHTSHFDLTYGIATVYIGAKHSTLHHS